MELINVTEVRDFLKNMNEATFMAYLRSHKVVYTKSKAYEEFGKVMIDTLITNKLLINSSLFPGKCKFLLSDIIAAIEILNNDKRI
ncbi:hypothetical protein IR083_23000 [Dysgonomonas sp. GY75]|uniref:hypothetical protein n=1 Tax=Dysgonomonas sp. GY75 TaxID=2780419 RepID=UPI0018843EA5|nr:hypothetical protein [Dysgonomonas sp. GY75]MBF0651690.1 hypothetical protein [Dysgonomonas sp. GY75]